MKAELQEERGWKVDGRLMEADRHRATLQISIQSILGKRDATVPRHSINPRPKTFEPVSTFQSLCPFCFSLQTRASSSSTPHPPHINCILLLSIEHLTIFITSTSHPSTWLQFRCSTLPCATTLLPSHLPTSSRSPLSVLSSCPRISNGS